MPLTLTVTEGVLPKGTEKATFARLCEAMLKWHGLTGNAAMTPNVVGSIHVLPQESTFAGLHETDRKSTRLNSSHSRASRMPSSA